MAVSTPSTWSSSGLPTNWATSARAAWHPFSARCTPSSSVGSAHLWWQPSGRHVFPSFERSIVSMRWKKLDCNDRRATKTFRRPLDHSSRSMRRSFGQEVSSLQSSRITSAETGAFLGFRRDQGDSRKTRSVTSHISRQPGKVLYHCVGADEKVRQKHRYGSRHRGDIW